MNVQFQQDTAGKLIAAGVALFAERGYDGVSVRALTRQAGTNLGAITYHFRTKEDFYDAVVAAVVNPAREYLARAVGQGGTPLDRIERFVRGIFDYLGTHPEFSRLIMQHFAGSRPLPDAFRRVIHGNIAMLTGLIEEGQRDGSIRAGDPRLMAPSIVSQPMYITLARQVIHEGLGIDIDDPDAREHLVDSVVVFIRGALARTKGGRQ